MAPENQKPSAWRADLALVFITLIWGSTFVLVKEALAGISILLFLALRFTIASAALAAAFRPLPGRFVERRKLLRGGIVAGAFLFAGYFFQTFGLRYTTASKSAFLTGLSIVIVPALAAVFERRAPRLAEAIGIAVATAGMALMTMEGPFGIGYGDLLTIFCAFGFAAHILVVGHFAPQVSFAGLTLVQIATAAALGGATCWWVERPYVHWTPAVISALAITGLLATAVAFSLQAWAQQYTTPTRTALIFALEPVFAWVTSFLIAGELLSARASAGAVLILTGILLVELKPIRSKTV